ncbi:MAG: class I SAM-dependent methyltransferase [Candidatus Nanosalina sp.]
MDPEKAVEDVLEHGGVDLYGESAELYDIMFSSNTSVQNKEQSVRRNVPEGSRVLDLACGTGIATERIGQDYDVTGVDLSREMLEVASRKVLEADLAQADMRSLPYEEEFDAVVMYGHPLSHLESFHDVDQTLRSVYGTLKEDGVLVTDFLTERIGDVESMGSTEKELGKYTVRMRPEFSDYNPATHEADCTIRFEIEDGEELQEFGYDSRVKGFSPEQLRHMLEEAGFDTVEEQTIFHSQIQQGIRAEKGDPGHGVELGFSM